MSGRVIQTHQTHRPTGWPEGGEQRLVGRGLFGLVDHRADLPTGGIRRSSGLAGEMASVNMIGRPYRADNAAMTSR